MEPQKPRPNLNLNKEYIDQVGGLMKQGRELEEIHFEYLEDVFSDLGITGDIYTDRLGPEGEKRIKDAVESTFIRLNLRSISEETLLKIYKLWDYLSEEDPLEKADLIYVFGGISQLAVDEAIRLKKENFAPKILFSGKKASYADTVQITEAEQYRNFAVEAGIDPVDILIEKESINTPENVVKSAQLLRALDFMPGTIIAVSLPYHMRRASLTLRAGFDWDFKLIRHPGKSAKYSRETYFKDRNGWSYICFEFFKLYGARKMGHF